MADEPALLIIEDEDDLREVLVDILQSTADRILTAADGQSALQLIRKQTIACILSDHQMPNMTGLDLLKQLTAEGSTVPFVLLTAYTDRERVTHALRLGAIDFIDKPFKPEQVTATIARALEIGKRRLAYQDGLKQLTSGTDHSPQVLEKLERDRKMAQLLQVANSEAKEPGKKKPIPSRD